MLSRVPLVVVLAGPNGAGKSTSAPYLLKNALTVEQFVNADTIAHGLSAQPETATVAAGRIMLDRLRELAKARRDFAFESTLSGRSYARWLRDFHTSGYRRHLVFLSLPSAELAIARVADRVRRGGHHIPADVVRRRFVAGLKNLFAVYMDAVDTWTVYDNAEVMSPRLIASRSNGSPTSVADPAARQRMKELVG